MRIIDIEIMGKKYPMSNSARVSKQISEKYGSRQDMRATLTGENAAETMDTVIWLLHALLEAGYKAAKKEGRETPPPPSEDDLWDGLDMDDLHELERRVMEAMTASSEPDVMVEAIDPKNAEAAPEK